MNSGGLIEAWPSAISYAAAARLFPPVNSGGLIERSYYGIRTVRAFEFPRVNSGGASLKRARWCACADPSWLFPPVNSGGLIEARDRDQGFAQVLWGFRR